MKRRPNRVEELLADHFADLEKPEGPVNVTRDSPAGEILDQLDAIRARRLAHVQEDADVVMALSRLLPAFRAALVGEPVPNADELVAAAEIALTRALQGDDEAELSLAERMATEVH